MVWPAKEGRGEFISFNFSSPIFLSKVHAVTCPIIFADDYKFFLHEKYRWKDSSLVRQATDVKIGFGGLAVLADDDLKLFFDERCPRESCCWWDKPQVWSFNSGDLQLFCPFDEDLRIFSWIRHNGETLGASETCHRCGKYVP